MSHVFLVTASFPYGVGEQFLEQEIRYWNGHPITILPLKAIGRPRYLEYCGIQISSRCAILNPQNRLSFECALRVLSECTLRDEIRRVPSILTSTTKIKRLLRHLYCGQLFEDAAERIILEFPPTEHLLFYTYWFSWATMALSRLRARYPNIQVVTRAHRGDVYEYASDGGYMPLRKSYHSGIDRIYAISEDARTYMGAHYGIPLDKITVSRLGAEDPGVGAPVNHDPNRLKLLSVSYAKPVKRIHRIIDGIALLTREYPNLRVDWVHIGDGPLLDDLKSRASRLGVTVDWLGQMPQPNVLEFLRTNAVDVFLNTSESEGVPVSIMEAISFGVPVVATDVGGTAEILSEEVGVLLRVDFSNAEFVHAVMTARNHRSRDAIRRQFKRACAASVLYPAFVSEVGGRAS